MLVTGGACTTKDERAANKARLRGCGAGLGAQRTGSVCLGQNSAREKGLPQRRGRGGRALISRCQRSRARWVRVRFERGTSARIVRQRGCSAERGRVGRTVGSEFGNERIEEGEWNESACNAVHNHGSVGRGGGVVHSRSDWEAQGRRMWSPGATRRRRQARCANVDWAGARDKVGGVAPARRAQRRGPCARWRSVAAA